MTLDSRIPFLLLDLAEVQPDKLDEWQVMDILIRFNERANEILKVWPKDGFAAMRETVSESTGEGLDTAPDTSEESSTRKDDGLSPVEPVIHIEGVKGFWGHSIGLTRDPAKVDPTLKRFLILPIDPRKK